MAIPVVLWYFARKRRDLPFRHLFWLFGLFIIACGTTHLMGYVIFKTPVYRLEGIIKLITAVASWGTVLALIPVTPAALAMRTPEELQREIDERKRVEQELIESNRLLENKSGELQGAYDDLEGFSYSVSHDLRTPLRGILSLSRIVREDNQDTLSEQGREDLIRLESEALRMAKIVGDLLEFSRLGRKELSTRPVDLSAMARTVSARVMEAYPDRKVDFEIEPGLAAKADPALLDLMLFNLIDNAVKYTASKDSAAICFGQSAEPANAVRTFFIRDNGIGFEQEFGDKMFQPFERLHRDHEYPGTGIGLANVKRIVERHGGQLWAESVSDGGATFYFSLKD